MIPYMSSEFVATLISRPVPSQGKNGVSLCALVNRLEGFMKASLMASPNLRLWVRINFTHCSEFAPRNQGARSGTDTNLTHGAR